MIRSIIVIAFTAMMFSCSNNSEGGSTEDSVSVLKDDTASLPEVDTLAPANMNGQTADSSSR